MNVPATRKEFYQELGRLDEAFAKLKPELELIVRDPQMDLEGYVVVWSTLAAIGGPLGRCGKGGTRITPQVSLDEIKMLAKIMTLKNAAAGLPLGGAKSGIKADPDAPDFEKKYRRFVQLVKPVLWKNGGIFGGLGYDIGARPVHSVWACEEIGSPYCFTGKKIEMGGTDYDKEGIAGLGVAVAARALLKVKGEDITKTDCAIQGVGAMGAAVLRYFREYGGIVKYISDPMINGTYFFENGIRADLTDKIINHDLLGFNKLIKAQGHVPASLEEILYEDVAILFPCAAQDVIDKDNVNKIRARYVVEGANNPCSEEARTKLFERGVLVIPDFIANSGGIMAAFIEMTSKVSVEENIKTKKKVEEAKNLTIRKIDENVVELMRIAENLKIELVHAGRYLVFKNIFK